MHIICNILFLNILHYPYILFHFLLKYQASSFIAIKVKIQPSCLQNQGMWTNMYVNLE
jgi:hypothetical protein